MATKKTEDAGTAGVLDETIAPESVDIPLGDLEEAIGVTGDKSGVDYQALAELRKPFAQGDIGLLPRSVDKGGQKLKCERTNGNRVSVDGKFCGGYHEKSLHLDFVGHAALTNRFLNADPTWSWEPLASGPDGLPLLDKMGGMWITLTIGGVTRLGYGDAQGKTMSTMAMKEIIGDALRNAGMRFGGALNLWHKGDLFENAVEQGKVAAAVGPAATRQRAQRAPAATAQAPAVEPDTEQPQQEPVATEQQPYQATPEASPTAQAPKQQNPPDGWEADLKYCTTLALMGALYKRAEREGWWTTDVQLAFTKHRQELDRKEALAAQEQMAGAFQHPESTMPEDQPI